MRNQLEIRSAYATVRANYQDFALPCQPHLQPPSLLEGSPNADFATLQRVAAALRAQPDSGRRPRSGTPADIARLRQDMGSTIADLWSTPPEEVHDAS